MSISFAGSPNPTIGVEVEVQLIDPKTLDLVPRSIELLDICKKHKISGAKAEITQAMLEIDSHAANDIKECRARLQERLTQLRQAASELGVRLNMSGTHPFQRWTDLKIFPNPRFEHMLKKFQWLARRLMVYGAHVQIGVPSGEQAIAITNHVIQYLPHLLALSASSPYWEGFDTGLQSCRIGILESFPISGRPYYFPDWSGFEDYCNTLHNIGAIESIKDIYWFVRPRGDNGTLEFRICDGMPTLTETVAVAALIQALVVWINEGLKDGSRKRDVSMRRYWIAPENQWLATRDGLDGMLIVDEGGRRRKLSDDVMELVETLRPVARKLNSEEELCHVKQMVCHGSSATRQRAEFVRTGRLTAVVHKLMEEFETDQPSTSG